MSSFQNEEQQRLELLAGKVLGDLTVEEEQLFEALESDPESLADLWELEKSAASADLAFARNETFELDEDLKDRILANAALHLKKLELTSTAVENIKDTSREAYGSQGSVVRKSSGSVGRREFLAWACCAASIAFAAFIWSKQSSSVNEGLALSPADERTALVENETDLTRVEWANGPNAFKTPVGGDVVWSNKLQLGFMKFEGMPINDPSVEQYQLWIIDPARDDEPIDGGVFDIASDGSVVVPINAKLPVIDPRAFAITIEKPGGVVVSTQERLPLLAAL